MENRFETSTYMVIQLVQEYWINSLAVTSFDDVLIYNV